MNCGMSLKTHLYSEIILISEGYQQDAPSRQGFVLTATSSASRIVVNR